MNSKEARDRKFQIMKMRMSRPSAPTAQEIHLQRITEIAEVQNKRQEYHLLEQLVQSRRSSNAIERLVEVIMESQKLVTQDGARP